MASVFKRGRDKGKKGTAWSFKYLDENGQWRMKKGFTDKNLTKQLANKLEHEAMLRRTGLIDPADEDRLETRQSTVEEHLKSYEKSLLAKKVTETHIEKSLSRIRKIVDGCDWSSLGDMKADDVEAFLVNFAAERGIGNRTYNHYLQAIDAFGNWLAHPQRELLPKNPFSGLARRNTNVDVRHQRRALSQEEFAVLLHTARTSPRSIQCYSGEVRARIYLLSYMTGLRRSELASLTPRSFDLESLPATVTVEAANSKHRKKDVLPLHAEFVEELRGWLDGHAPDAPLFPKLAKRRTWLMVKRDLEAAGIPYETDEGIADFHAAGRHTHITELLRNGATLPQAKELARHSDVRMT